MRRLLSIRTLALMMALSAAVAAHSYTLTNETLHYDIVYHWGLIWKHAGSATLSIKKSGYNYDASLSARTISWADKVFRVRDTLSCTIQPSGMRPIVYRKASHEGKHSGIDIVRYSYNGNTSLAECTRIRPGEANNVVRLQANGQAYDMLSIFFYIRALDYKAMVKNHIYTTTVFSGKRRKLCAYGLSARKPSNCATSRNTWLTTYRFLSQPTARRNHQTICTPGFRPTLRINR